MNMMHHSLRRLEISKPRNLHSRVPVVSDEEEDEDLVDPSYSLNDSLTSLRINDHDTLSDEDNNEPERSQESWSSGRQSTPRDNSERNIIKSLPKIHYGGHFLYEGKKVLLNNTCNLDSIQQLLYYLYKTHDATQQFIRNHYASLTQNSANLIAIFKNFDSENWAVVRTITLLKMLKMPVADPGLPLNIYGSEERFLHSICNLVPIQQITDCPNRRCDIPKIVTLFPMKDLVISDPSSISDILSVNNKSIKCPLCDSKYTEQRYSWTQYGSPPFFCFPIAHGDNSVSGEVDLPLNYDVLGTQFTLFGYTVHDHDHYTGVVLWQKKRYVYDGNPGGPSPIIRNHTPFPSSHRVSCVLLKKTE